MIRRRRRSLTFPFVRTLGNLCPPAAVIRLFAGRPEPFVLESVCNTSGYGRYTLLGHTPVERLCIAPDSQAASSGVLLERLAEALTRQPRPEPSIAPFAAGWVGYISYEAGAVLERVQPRPQPGTSAPLLDFGLYDTVAIYDHLARVWRLCAVDLPASRRPATDRLNELAELINAGRASHAAHDMEATPATSWPPAVNMTRPEYLDKVAQAIEHIRAGDIYQVNLTQRFSARTNMDPVGLYLRLRRTNPADFAALLPAGNRAVVSCSPELFLDVTGRRVVTRPIKGTRPRTGDALLDTARRAELLASAKDEAELNMIVDLLRNDLGRVCEFGSVRVTSPRDIEDHPTVLHSVATIAGTLRHGVGPAELLRATFPGGSVTGCPKIRAMQIIRELEPTPRDAYCGAIGCLGLDGNVTLSIAIRTMVHEAGQVHVYAGGAITAESDAEAEYAETLAKAEGMFRALGHSAAGVDGANSGSSTSNFLERRTQSAERRTTELATEAKHEAFGQ